MKAFLTILFLAAPFVVLMILIMVLVLVIGRRTK